MAAKMLMLSSAMVLLLLASLETATSFAFHRTLAPTCFIRRPKLASSALEQVTEQDVAEEPSYKDESGEQNKLPKVPVRAPLKFIGPYPCLGLTFPKLSTTSQRARNVTGVSLDFLLDTAANTNTINGLVAKELHLPVVGQSLPAVGAGGAIPVAPTYLLGDCQLEGLPEEERFTFMQNLTASALPVASPASAGLLSVAFFRCFEGGVEFQWLDGTISDNNNECDKQRSPSVTFYGPGESDELKQEMTRVSLKELPTTCLPSIQMNINGVSFPALLDTGSPITILNAKAAEMAGVSTVDFPGTKMIGNEKSDNYNPLANMANRFKNAQATAQARARGDVLSIAGFNGQRVDLFKSSQPARLGVQSAGSDDRFNSAATVDFGHSHVYVGDLPGLVALNALGDDSAPAAVLGMDVLRLLPKMLFCPRDKEVYF